MPTAHGKRVQRALDCARLTVMQDSLHALLARTMRFGRQVEATFRHTALSSSLFLSNATCRQEMAALDK